MAADIRNGTSLVTPPARKAEQADRPAAAPRLTGMLAGTRLLTPNGYQPVESLRRGDMIATLIGRGPMFVPIAWIGWRSADVASEGDPDSGPVRILHNAIGDAMPNRDILLAPEHAIYLQGAWYLAKHLVNHTSIIPEQKQRAVEFWGVRLERYDVLVAENLAIESLPPVSVAAFAEVTTPLYGEISDPDVAPSPEPFTLAPPPSPSRKDRLLYVEIEARTVMSWFAELATQRGVRLEIAVEPGLIVRMAQHHLHELLGAGLTHAIHAGGDHVLLTGMLHAGRAQIAMIDAGGGTNREQQEADLRPAARLAALQGATLEIDVRPGEGTIVLLRLLAQSQGI